MSMDSACVVSFVCFYLRVKNTANYVVIATISFPWTVMEFLFENSFSDSSLNYIVLNIP